MEQDFRTKTISGLSWSVAGHIGRQGITLIIGIILARLLSPEEFGLIAMVTVLTGFADLFLEMGFGAALIQKKNLEEIHLSSIFWVNILAGVLLTAVFLAGSGPIAGFYERPILEYLTVALSFNFLIGSWGVVQRSLYTREIDFKSLSLIEAGSAFVSGVIAVYLAFTGFGVWSLVIKSLLQTFLTTCMLWFMSSWKPRFMFELAKVRELAGFSMNLLGDKVLNYFATNTDDLLIGKVLGSSPLGLYSRAYMLMQLPMSQISWVISRVMFPSFATIQDDKERIAAIYLKMSRVIALVTFPMMTGLFVLASEFVLQVFGEQWRAMIPLVQVFCILGMLKSIATLVGNLYLSQGRADLQLKIGLGTKTFMIVSIIVGLNWGVEGVAVAYTLASIISMYPEFYYAGRLVGLTWTDMIKNLAGIFAISIIMAAGIYFFANWMGTYFSGISILIINILAGILFYWGLVHFLKVSAYRELLGVFKK